MSVCLFVGPIDTGIPLILCVWLLYTCNWGSLCAAQKVNFKVEFVIVW